MDSTINHTALMTMSDYQQTTQIEAVVCPDDRKGVDEIVKKLNDEIKSVAAEITRELKGLKCKQSIAPNSEKTVILQDMSTLLESKTRIINEMTKHIRESNFTDFPRYYADAVLGIPLRMQEETASCQDALKFFTSSRMQDEEDLKRFTETKEFLQEIFETPVDALSDSERLAQIHTVAKRELKECQRDMQNILKTLIPREVCDKEADIMDVLTKLVENSTESKENGWYELTESSELRVLNYLATQSVLIRNPENGRQFKLILD